PEQVDRLFHGELLGELSLLQRDSQQLPELPVVRSPAAAQHQHLASIRSVDPLTDLDGGSLSRAVRAQEAEALSRVDLEIEAVDCDDILVGFAEIANLECGALVRRPHGRNHNAARIRAAWPCGSVLGRL